MKGWELEPAAFDRLLNFLGADRNKGAEQYERIRQKLIKFFTWRGCVRSQECADETIDRVARRLSEGLEIEAADPYAYFHGTALRVLQEYWRNPTLREEPIEHTPLTSLAAPEKTGDRDRERRLDCLDDCLKQMPRDAINLLTTYHEGEKRSRIDARLRLASSLGIPLNALRIRAFRLRSNLEQCIDECAGRRNAS